MAAPVKKKDVNENEILARMAGGGMNNHQPLSSVPTSMISPVKEREESGNGEEQIKDVRNGGNGKKNAYEEKYFVRNIYGVYRGNVGISKDTLAIAERVVARVFDNRIAIGAFIDNILWEHFNKHKKDYELWLAEKPTAIF
ncbi:MAG: DUF3408 domain-containing protein [Bacteroidales bacterium]|jgi:hypothetical protein|nr:DUF3408 domain-containing protein [Bacteroidales bacterium]